MGLWDAVSKLGIGGWVGGGGGGGGKDAERSADISRQREEFISIIDQYLSQLAPGSEEYNQLVTFGQKYLQMIDQGAIPVSELGGSVLDQQPAATEYGSRLVRQQQARIASGGAATPQEARTNLAVEGVRKAAAFTPEEQAVFQGLRGEEPTTDIARLFRSLIDTANAPVDSLYEPELNLLQDRVNREAAQRGLVSSGIPLERLGRAGVELAINEALRREDVRRNRLRDVEQLYSAGQALRGREIGVEEAVTDLQAGRESRLTDLLARQGRSSVTDLLDLLERRTRRTEEGVDVEADLAESRRQQIEAALGEIAGGVFGGIAGGPVGTATGSQVGRNVAMSTSQSPASTASLLSAQRTTPATSSGQPVDLSQTLNVLTPRRRRFQTV